MAAKIAVGIPDQIGMDKRFKRNGPGVGNESSAGGFSVVFGKSEQDRFMVWFPGGDRDGASLFVLSAAGKERDRTELDRLPADPRIASKAGGGFYYPIDQRLPHPVFSRPDPGGALRWRAADDRLLCDRTELCPFVGGRGRTA